MQITEQQIAEIFDYSRFEPSKAMENIVRAFEAKYLSAQKNSREKISFEEMTGDTTAKVTRQQGKENLSKDNQKKGKFF